VADKKAAAAGFAERGETTQTRVLHLRALTLTLILASALAAQTTVFRSETRVVELPVIATDLRNKPVADLRMADLRLLDNGVEQQISTLEKFGSPARPGAAMDDPVGSRLGPRRSIVLFDKLNTPLPDQIRGQAGLSEMLRKLPESQDGMAIYALGGELQLLCNFKTDPDILRSAFDAIQAEQLPIGATPPPSAAGRQAQPAEPADPLRLAERRLAITLDGLAAIARRMSALPGEKTLIWMTAGFPPPENPQRFYEVSRQLRDAKVRVYPVDARGLIACLSLPCPPWVNLHIGMMEEVAEQTGGRAFHDNNGLAALARAALGDSRQGYLLTYTPNNYSHDGSAHRVELQIVRKGIALRYRSGYTAEAGTGPHQ
jgi:VWFA-related protein